MFVQSAITIEGRKQIQVGAGGQSEVLEPGVYDVWAATDAYIKCDQLASDVTTTTGYFIPGGAGPVSVRIAGQRMRIGATAAIAIHRVE